MNEEKRKRVNQVLLNRQSTAEQHIKIFKELENEYIEQCKNLVENGVELAPSCKVRGAYLAWKGGYKDVTTYLMDNMIVSEILSLAKLLDCQRRIRAIDSKLNVVRKKRKVSKLKHLRSQLAHDDLGVDGPSATKAFNKRVRNWVSKIPKDRLEFFLLNFPKEPWRELADIVHFSPQDFKLDYFLPCIFGEAAPKDTVVYVMENCKDSASLVQVLKDHPSLSTCYSFLRQRFAKTMTNQAKEALCSVISLSDAIWFYEELECPKSEKIIEKRLANGESFIDSTGKGRDSFGKVMERLLFLKEKNVSFLPYLQKHAQSQLDEIKFRTKQKVAIFGDASASMDVAIRSATIVAGAICSCFPDASLSFFNNCNFTGPITQPKTVDDILHITSKVRASSSTAPAASLYELYKHNIKKDMIIIVTDEVENCDRNGRWYHNGATDDFFSGLFGKYLKDVNPNTMLFMVSFWEKDGDGQMVEALKKAGYGERVQQFRFHPRCPDLTKLTTLLGMLNVETSNDSDSEGTEEILPSAQQVCITCKDGNLNVSTNQAKALAKAFKRFDDIPVNILTAALPALRLDDNTNDENHSINSDDNWSLLSYATN